MHYNKIYSNRYIIEINIINCIIESMCKQIYFIFCIKTSDALKKIIFKFYLFSLMQPKKKKDPNKNERKNMEKSKKNIISTSQNTFYEIIQYYLNFFN